MVTSIKHSTLASRRQATQEALKKIHGPGESCYAGIWDFVVHKMPTTFLEKLLTKSRKISSLIPKLVTGKYKIYAKTTENLNRSILYLYKGGLMSKRKYESLRVQHGPQGKLPSLTPYRYLKLKLKSYIDLPTSPFHTSGQKRDLKDLLIKVASLYLQLEKEQSGVITWFKDQPNCFNIAIGSDGAPFGKYETACSVLVSFLNILSKTQNPHHNFLLLGANEAEDSPNMIKFYTELTKEMKNIENESFKILGNSYTFKFSLLPNDTKMVCTLLGELNNAATYPSPYADIHKSNIIQINSKYHPWKFKERMKKAAQVEKYKKEHPKISRTKLTEYIASLHSRQEYPPRIGTFSDRVLIEPLHLRNNNFQFLFEQMLNISLQQTLRITSSISTKLKDYNSIPANWPIKKFIETLKHQVEAGKLVYRLKKGFAENTTTNIPSVRFVGEDSLKLSNKYGELVKCLFEQSDTDKMKKSVLAILYAMHCLREACGIFSKIHIKQNELQSLEYYCKQYYTTVAIFFRPTLSVWHLGHIVPEHCANIFEQLGYGLGLNAMQGREAKHLAIHSYAKHAMYHRRWSMIFEHEYMECIHLKTITKEKYYYKTTKPNFNKVDGGHCPICNLPQNKCTMCSTEIMADVKDAVLVRAGYKS